MELRQIEYFLAVVKHRNYTRAANALFVSQPTLSVAIQKLEGELGIKLLERDNKGLALTGEGEVFRKHAEKLLRDAEELQSVTRDLNPSCKKRIRIGFPSTVGSWLWKELFGGFHELYPEIELDVQVIGTLDIIRQLESMTLDIGYGVIDLVDADGIEREEIRTGELKLIMHTDHALASHDAVRISSLGDERVIMYNRNTTFTEKLFLDELRKTGVEPEICYVREQSSVFDIVAQGCGVAPVLDDAITVIRDTPLITSRPFSKPLAYRAGMLWNRNAFLPEAVRSFQAFVRSCRL